MSSGWPNFFIKLCLGLALGNVYALDVNSWKRFRNKLGYEVRYPSCWAVDYDSPDHAISIEEDDFVSIQKTAKCAQFAGQISALNGISVSGALPIDSESDKIRDIEMIEAHAKSEIAVGRYRVVKRLKLGSADAISYVEILRSDASIRWQTKLYCPGKRIAIIGPTVAKPSVDYEQKFKAGDLAIPEPEKTIVESFRCLPKK